MLKSNICIELINYVSQKRSVSVLLLRVAA
jgi:hypothetical protein